MSRSYVVRRECEVCLNDPHCPNCGGDGYVSRDVEADELTDAEMEREGVREEAA